MVEIISGLEVLHRLNIVHRDLKVIIIVLLLLLYVYCVILCNNNFINIFYY